MSIINKIPVQRAKLFAYPSQHAFKTFVDGKVESKYLTPSNMMVQDTLLSNLDKAGIRPSEVSQQVDFTRIERAERLNDYVSHQKIVVKDEN